MATPKVEEIRKTRTDGTRWIQYRVRWTDPRDGHRYGFTKLADKEDSTLFIGFLISANYCVTTADTGVIQGAWRDGYVPAALAPRLTFGAFARTHIDNREASEKTKRGLRAILRNHFADLDALPLAELTQVRALAKLATLENAGLSSSTVIHYSWFLWGVATAAVSAGVLSAHPFRKTSPGTRDIDLAKPENARRRLTDDSFNLSEVNYGALLGAAAELDEQTFQLLQLILVTGLRIGEALALQIRHLDFTNGRVLVRQALVRGADGSSSVGNVKKGTEHVRSDSERDVTFPDGAADSLSEYLTRTGVSLDDGNRYVFPRPRCIRGNSPWDYSGWHRARWTRVVKLAHADYELPADIQPTPHCLRHTYASRMLNNGMSVYDVSKLLGHRDTKVTERIYLHACHNDLHERAQAAAARILPARGANVTVLRNGWYLDAAGVKRRRKAA